VVAKVITLLFEVITMNNFIDVLHTLQSTVPKLKPVICKWFVYEDNPRLQIKISKPCAFDDYGDIIARVTLYKDDNPIWDVLISYNTDLNRLCEKISRKFKELT
jgi:hypothetical protein